MRDYLLRTLTPCTTLIKWPSPCPVWSSLTKTLNPLSLSISLVLLSKLVPSLHLIYAINLRVNWLHLPSDLCRQYQGSELNKTELSKWFARNQLDANSGKVVVKPARAGSSIGVTVEYDVADSLKKANEIILEGIDDKVLVEIFLEGGSEYTAIVLDVGSGSDCHPIVLLPTEVSN